MASTPFFFSGLLFLAWFTADVHSVKVLPDVLEGSTVILRLDESVTSITAITWKHGDNLAVDWLGGDKTFYNIFNNTCSLNTETGELTIYNVRLAHSGVYTPDINGRTRSAMELRVFLKVLDVLKGSTVILPPVESVSSITAITWKHGDNLAVDWFGGNKAFYHIFKDTCSLNTETGELTIHNVRPEHSGVYTPEINGTTRSAMKLRVLSPVPKPSISHDCNPEKTKCNLTCTLICTLTCTDTCKIDTTGDLGDVEVFWTLDDSRVNGSELQITDKDRNKTFICSLKNSVSSENSTEVHNPLLPSDTGVPVWIIVFLLAVLLVLIALLVFFKRKWIVTKYRLWRIMKIMRVMCKLMPVTEHDRILEELPAAGSVPDRDQALINVDGMILRILREGNKRNLSEDSILMLLTARYVILRILQGPAVKDSRENVKKIMEKFFKGTDDLGLSDDENKELLKVNLMIFKILDKSKELQLSEEEDQALQDAHEVIWGILKEINKRNLSAGEERRRRNGASNDTSRPRDPAAEPLNSSSSSSEAEDKV